MLALMTLDDLKRFMRQGLPNDPILVGTGDEKEGTKLEDATVQYLLFVSIVLGEAKGGIPSSNPAN